MLGRATPTTENMRAERLPTVSPAQIHAQRTQLNRPARFLQCSRVQIGKCGRWVVGLTANIKTEATSSDDHSCQHSVHLPSQPNMTAPNGLLMKPRANMLLCRVSSQTSARVKLNPHPDRMHMQSAGTCNLMTLW